jgi:predicted ATPase/DNA-binding XRE family transcriptional regulator
MPSVDRDVSPRHGTRATVWAHPPWSEVLRALREARGVTQEGWAARLGVSRATVQRWEHGKRAPDTRAETAILTYCREAGLLRAFARGRLAGLTLSEADLQDLFAQARWQVHGGRSDGPASTHRDGRDGARLPTSNVPVPLTSFIGRERELAAVRRVQANTRQLTLAGPGGAGKTRLALELAGELLWAYPDGVWLVDLASPADPALVPQAIAAALRLRLPEVRSPVDEVKDFLQGRHLLLLLDNCEHLLPACAELAEALLRACPMLSVVATSREPLGIAGEVVWRVPSLSLPQEVASLGSRPQAATDQTLPNVEALLAYDAVQLFVERARLRRPDFALTQDNASAVVAICRQLDGMPLAIELAAARVSVLSVGQIEARLRDRFHLLTGGRREALPRHQTLRAAMDWSHDLLTALEKALLRALSVFAGGFTLEAVEAVCGAQETAPLLRQKAGRASDVRHRPPVVVRRDDILDLLAHLVDKSLVLTDESYRSVRYRLLETVRQYAAERLDEAGEALAVRQRHATWCLALAEEGAAAMEGPREGAWLSQLEQERDNVRAALDWSLAHGQGLGEQARLAATTALRLAGALPRFWVRRGHWGEARRWLAQVLAVAGEAPAADRAKALRGAGILAYLHGDFVMAHGMFTASLALYRDLGDELAITRSQQHLGATALRLGDYAGAHTLFEANRARYEALGYKPGLANLQFTLGVLSFRQGDYAGARTSYAAGLALNRELGHKHGVASALAELASLHIEQGEDGPQAALLEESLALFQELGEKSGVATVLGHLGLIAWTRGEHERATALLQEGLALNREADNRRGIARMLVRLSLAAYSRGDYVRATAMSREGLALYHAAGDTWEISRYLWIQAAAAFGQGRPERAARLFGTAAALRDRLGVSLPAIFQPTHDGAVAALRADLSEPAFAAAWAAGQALSLAAAIDGGHADEAAPVTPHRGTPRPLHHERGRAGMQTDGEARHHP